MLHGQKKFLEHKAYLMRRDSLRMTTAAGSGHPTSALSAADIVSALFFYGMHFNPDEFENPNNDRFILSKGHASPIFYAAWKQLGKISDEQLLTYRQFDSILEGHPTLRFKYTEAATGSLGIGLSIGAGMAYEAHMDKRPFFTYVLMGDSEITEGSIWEAAEISSFYKLNQLIGIVDCNRLGQSTETIHGYHLQRYADKFEAFGWKTIIIDGHDMLQICSALDKARNSHDRPTMIIAKTIKGYGVHRVENKEGYHGKVFSPDELPGALHSLEKEFPQVALADSISFSWHPQLPPHKPVSKQTHCSFDQVKLPLFDTDKLLATRKAYGYALASVGSACESIISLDAEVKNSTYAEIFEDKFPDRFIQCFIAEQNMVGMAVGLQRREKIPFVSTFGAFFSRAYDQIRMAAIGSSPLRLVGSHAGVSIGQDGPSQMALEDIALMRALPGSVVLYPCDAPSTAQLVWQMAQHNQSISYLRTTRMDTPILYNADEKFPIGGCKILHETDADVAVLIGAGITLHEAIKAYHLLAQEKILVTVVDLYSIKPLDEKTLIRLAGKTKKIITAEDHYRAGGLGEAVAYALRDQDCIISCLAVPSLPRSGQPFELLAWAGIDAAAMVSAVKNML